jgi:hypothetical protein
MEKRSKEWLVALTGVGFILALVASFIVMGGDPPEAKDGGQKIIDYYVDNKDQIEIAALLSGLIVAFLVFFFAYVNRLVGAALGGSSTLPTVGIVGAAMVGIAGALDSTLQFALAEAADDIDPAAAQAIQAIFDNDFIPFMVGTALAMLATGIGVVKSGILPKWLGWAAVVIGVLSATPVGFFAAPLAALWIVVVSIMLSLRARSGSGTSAATA